MIIATSITESYLERSKPFFESVNKHFTGKKICFCLGFQVDIEGWETVLVPISDLRCTWQPKNRKSYYSLQHGEFMDHYEFDYDEDILFIDSDMILQRPFNLNFDFDEAQFFVTDSSFPATTLIEVIKNLDGMDQDNFIERYGIDDSETEFCAGWMCAKARDWQILYNLCLREYEGFLSYFSHHAAWQLLINFMIINYFRVRIVNSLIQNADWYSGTAAKNVDDVLKIGDNTVYFNHTKFNGNYKY